MTKDVNFEGTLLSIQLSALLHGTHPHSLLILSFDVHQRINFNSNSGQCFNERLLVLCNQCKFLVSFTSKLINKPTLICFVLLFIRLGLQINYLSHLVGALVIRHLHLHHFLA
jgi:hypothetical protein